MSDDTEHRKAEISMNLWVSVFDHHIKIGWGYAASADVANKSVDEFMNKFDNGVTATGT